MGEAYICDAAVEEVRLPHDRGEGCVAAWVAIADQSYFICQLLLFYENGAVD